MPQYLSPGVYVEEVPPLARPIVGVGTSTPAFIGVVPDEVFLPARPAADDTDSLKKQGYKWVKHRVAAAAKAAHLVTSWTQYVKLFGDFTEDAAGTAETTGTPAIDTGQARLAHAVYGFFNNGGTKCYVVRVTAADALASALAIVASIDEVSMVAAPGMSSATAYTALIQHAENLQDRVVILDSVEGDAKFDTGDYAQLQKPVTSTVAVGRPPNSSYAAFYFPWLRVFDPATSLLQSANNGAGLVYVPPSGHVAGVYARSDATRGVFKAPANEAVLGAVDLKYSLSKADQESLNQQGVNVIRPLVGAYRIWGARTVGGFANGEYAYISTRRYLIYLRKSIDQGTQFAVFEPNGPMLWERIKRTVSGFLLNEWRSGALLGTTPEKAFFVKCDADTNPPEVREAGQVVTEIGVAVVKPAEFVIFRIQQTTGG